MNPIRRAASRTANSGAVLLCAGAVVALAIAAALASCSPAEPTPDASTADHDSIALPPTHGVFDYQLGGASDWVDRDAGTGHIDVVVRDASERPLPSAYSVCYVNGFQSQPGDADLWLARPHLLLRDPSGTPIIDPQWPGEYILDPRTDEQREGILEIIGPVIDDCARRGFDAVEIDNLDTWLRFEQIDRAGAPALAAAYVQRAHAAGLAIAQKNAAEVASIGHDELGFDFAVAEECGAWEECAAYTEVYGDHVLQIEYPDSLDDRGVSFEEVCRRADRAPLTILRDRGLVPAGSAGHLYRAC